MQSVSYSQVFKQLGKRPGVFGVGYTVSEVAELAAGVELVPTGTTELLLTGETTELEGE